MPCVHWLLVSCCLYRDDPPDDGQQAWSKHVEGYYYNKLIENSASCWFITYGYVTKRGQQNNKCIIKSYAFRLARKVFPFVATVWRRVCTETTNTYIQCCHIPAKHDVDSLCLCVLKIKVTFWKLWNIQGVPKNVYIIYMYICISIADKITLNIKNSNNRNKQIPYIIYLIYLMIHDQI